MAKPGLAKISRRRFNLETTVFSAQQEVTVPAALKIPVDTQYLLQPLLVVPRDKIAVQKGAGKVRVQGQLTGFISCVDSEETAHTFPLQPLEFVTSFSVHEAAPDACWEADVALDGVEVDRGEGDTANVTVYLTVSLRGAQLAETELVTAASGATLSVETRGIRLQNIIEERKAEKTLSVKLSHTEGIPVAADVCVANLSWQVTGGKLAAQGTVKVKVYRLQEKGGAVAIAQGGEDFQFELDFASTDVADCTLQCLPALTILEPEAPEVLVTLRCKAVGYREEREEYVAGVSGADSLSRRICLRNRIGESEYKLNIEGQVSFPNPSVQINQLLPRVRILETQALDGRVLIRGLLSLHIYYSGEEGRNKVLVQEEEFSHHLELRGCAAGYTVRAWAWPESGFCTVEDYSVPVILRVEAVEDVEFDAVTDIHVVDPGFVPVNASVVLYIAGKEDSLFSIARKFNVSQEMLMEYNGLSSPEISCGQKLLVPVYQMKYNDKV